MSAHIAVLPEEGIMESKVSFSDAQVAAVIGKLPRTEREAAVVLEGALKHTFWDFDPTDALTLESFRAVHPEIAAKLEADETTFEETGVSSLSESESAIWREWVGSLVRYLIFR